MSDELGHLSLAEPVVRRADQFPAVCALRSGRLTPFRTVADAH